MTPTQEKIMSALSIIDNCPLEISLRTGIPFQEAQIEMTRMASQDIIVLKMERGKPLFRKHNPYKSGQRMTL